MLRRQHLERLALLAALAQPGSLFAGPPPLRDVIDADIKAAWVREKVAPARPADDAEFLRRVYLDLAGSVPTYDDTVAFLDSSDPTKRERLIDRLLADSRYARHQADVWDQVLFGRHPPGYDTYQRDGFQTWLRGKFEKNVPYDAWVRELLKAEGNSVENGALYYAQYRSAPEDASEAISQTFLGIQLECARCHDHPFEDWTQRDFYGMAAFLTRLQIVGMGRKGNAAVYVVGERNTGEVLFTGPAKEARPGKKGEPVKPKFLLGPALAEPPLPKDFKEVRFTENKPPPAPLFSRKDRLAEWITRADNPFFARAAANRVWAQFMGRGLIHPIDNMSPSKQATHPELLGALTRALVEHQFDLKWYVRELVNSKTYQLSSAGTGEALPAWFQHARTRPLSAEELAEAWRTATGYREEKKLAGDKKTPEDRFHPLIGGYVLMFFGSPTNGKGDFQGGLHENLYLNNGPLLQMISGGKGGLAETVADKKTPAAARVERLFLTTLNRRPSVAEAAKFGGFSDDKAAAADAVWALITSSEFRFNH